MLEVHDFCENLITWYSSMHCVNRSTLTIMKLYHYWDIYAYNKVSGSTMDMLF